MLHRAFVALSAVLGLGIVLGACEPPIKSALDNTSYDLLAAPSVDLAGGPVAMDLSVTDGPKPSGADLKSTTDLKKPPPDGNYGPCTVGASAGTCITTSECAALGMMSTSGLCPGPSNVQCCTDPLGPLPDGGGAAMCPSTSYPTPNEGLYTSPGEGNHDGACPLGMVPVTTYCIDKYEASLYVVDDAGTVTGSWSPYKNPGTTKVRAASIVGAIPQGYINQLQSKAACEQAGKRLCSNTEWRAACQGPDSWEYPYGPTRIDDRCNDETDRVQHPAVDCFNSTDSSIWSKLGDPGISQQPMTVEPSGNKSQCSSPHGAMDLMGNLHEWTSDPAGTFQGGFYFDTVKNGPGCLYRTTAHGVTHWDYSTGFRCCK